MEPKNIEKRRRVMQRSIQLGHCICDPKLACPCDLLRDRDVCLCAGERLDGPAGPVRLTRLVEKTGCSSKIDQATLRRVLGDVTMPDDPRVLIGAPAGDDAGVFRMGDNGQAWVQTVDVFSPCVDDPYLFGQIAAANSVSDIYAMGATPTTALSIIGFPARELPDAIMRDILRGGVDKMAEAGVPVIGGHSINDREIKAGFAVTGLVDPERILSNAAAQPGDVLVLTKPIGTGILSFAAQIDRAPVGAMDAIGASMATLNKAAAETMRRFDVHACTDVTGFGLIGHLSAMAAASGVDVEIVWDDVPMFDGVLECVAAGIIPGGIERNRESSPDAVIAGQDVTPAMLDVLFDPQTSGGLLIAAVPQDARGLRDSIVPSVVIGVVTQKGTGRIHVRTTKRRAMPPTRAGILPVAHDDVQGKESTMSGCCSAGHGNTNESARRGSIGEPARPRAGGSDVTAAASESDTAAIPGDSDTPSTTGKPSDAAPHAIPDVQQKFQDFLRAANQPGALDAHTKQAICIALAVLAKCEPCVRSHIAKAREQGFTPAEIDEAAWLAISFGGASLMMFYNGVRKECL